MPGNNVLDLDLVWVNNIKVNDSDIITDVATGKFTDKTCISQKLTPSWLMDAISFVDLALLCGNETPENIRDLCQKAAAPFTNLCDADIVKITELAEGRSVHCAAVCIYPLRIEDASQSLSVIGADKTTHIASVAAGFPSGQFPLYTRLGEIFYAVALGVQEIDVVIDRTLVLRGLWQQLYNELVEMRMACKKIMLKVILSVTECGSWTNVYKASVVAMLAGADFIKTSTGKELTSMTMHEGFVMCTAIKDFHSRTGVKVGLKPAGGVRTAEQAVSWMLMVQQLLGDEWLDPELFRIGTGLTSSLIENLTNALIKCHK